MTATLPEQDPIIVTIPDSEYDDLEIELDSEGNSEEITVYELTSVTLVAPPVQ